VLRRDLQWALRKKRPEIPLERFILHQDNAPAHTAAATQLEISVLGMKQMSHPPYSPDLAPFDFAIFPHIKLQLKGVRFETLKDLQTAVNGVIKSTTSQWYNDIILNQWAARHQRCVLHSGAYFEKL